MHRFRFSVSVALATLVASALALPAASSGSAASGSAASDPTPKSRVAASTLNPTASEARFVALMNQERERRGLRPLAWEPTLCLAGRQHSEEMARLDYFDHRSPVASRETPADRWETVVSHTPDEYVLGENLFFGSVADVRWGHDSLMDSAGHRQNILSRAYTKVGVGVYVDRQGQMWVTQMFLS